MERYQVILAYDGTDFHGSQYQAEARTVQSVIEAALRKLNWSGKSTLFAGRTDAGVHALGQVVAFDLDWNHSTTDLANALNALLPEDVAVRDVSVCPADFHPRFDAISRSYCYRVYCQPVRNPLLERYAWRVWPAPDFTCLKATSQVLVGIHDFAGFGRATSPGGSTIRQVMDAAWRRVPPSPSAFEQLQGEPVVELDFEITANAYLYHMVRRLVYVMIEVGLGNLVLDDLLRNLHAPQSEPVPGLAPPQGLALVGVAYPPGKGENKTM